MPRGDRTGPNGAGQMTGRALGNCGGYGRGLGGGRGRGYGRGFSPAYPDVSEKTLLENEIRVLKDQMTALEKRLSEAKDE